jgi:hypothetical protein
MKITTKEEKYVTLSFEELSEIIKEKYQGFPSSDFFLYEVDVDNLCYTEKDEATFIFKRIL